MARSAGLDWTKNEGILQRPVGFRTQGDALTRPPARPLEATSR